MEEINKRHSLTLEAHKKAIEDGNCVRSINEK